MIAYRQVAYFKAFDEGVPVVLFDSKYYQVGFNLVSVQVCYRFPAWMFAKVNDLDKLAVLHVISNHQVNHCFPLEPFWHLCVDVVLLRCFFGFSLHISKALAMC